MTVSQRWAEAVVDLDAIAHNLETLRAHVAPGAVWAVVKADAYGHGALPVARTAVAAGAEGLCVALVDEGVALRRGGITAPILVFGPQPESEIATALEHELVLTVHDVTQVTTIAEIARSQQRSGVRVQVEVDTGMRRVGASIAAVPEVVEAVRAEAPGLVLDAVYSHLACGDDPQHPATPVQIDAFDEVLATLADRGLSPPRVHLANSAGALVWPRAHHDLVRCGIAVYGLAPGPELVEHCRDLRGALTLRSRVSMVKRIHAGDGVSYGWHTVVDRDLTAATVPLGYADGVPRALGTTGGEVLIGGRRRRILGVVTMDQFVVDCGGDEIAVGDEVVLIGAQGSQRIGAEDWAARVGTIAYEIVCGVSARVPRRWVGGPR